MQVWQLFHIIQEYCDITRDNSSLYCNMIKFLLRQGKIRGEQSIDSLTSIQPLEWRSYFFGSLYSTYNVEKLRTILKNVEDYLSSHGIVSVIHPPSRLSKIIDREKVYAQERTRGRGGSIGKVAISLMAGFVIGCFYSTYATWANP